MLLTLHFLLWGSIVASTLFLATSSQLTQALRDNWRSLSLVVLLAFIWRLPFDGHFFYGLEYEDSYIYPVASRYLDSHAQHDDPATSSFLTTVCAVGNWSSCRIPETSSRHFIGYPFMIAVASKVFGYSPRTASYISLAASLIAVVVVFLVGKLVDPSGVSGLAAALIFSLTPVFGVHGVGTYAEPVSNLLMVTSLLMCLCLLGPSNRDSRPSLLINWIALTFTAILAIVVKRENLLIVPVVLLAKIMFQKDCDSVDVPKRRLQYVAALITILFCAGFALNQLRLLAVIHHEQLEYSQFPFNFHVWLTMLPMFLKGYFSWSWYFGSAFLVLLGAFWSIKSRRPGALVAALFAAYLLLYTSHVRSYYQVHGAGVTELDTLRYSMNLAGLWAVMAGLGLSTLILWFSQLGLGDSGTRWLRRTLWIGVAGYTLCTWVATDRLKEDMASAVTQNRPMMVT